MNWIKKHKILTVILIITALGVIGSIGNKGGSSTAKTDNGAKQASQSQPEQKKLDVKAFYDQVQNGQTKEQVIQLAGKDPDSCSENEIAGYGKTEVCNWNGSFSDSTFVSISFKDNAVNMKNKTGF